MVRLTRANQRPEGSCTAHNGDNNNNNTAASRVCFWLDCTLDPSTAAMRIPAPVILAVSAPLCALAIPNPIFLSLRSLVRQASELTGFDLGLLNDAMQHIVEGQQDHVKQWTNNGRAMIEQAGVVCKSFHCRCMDIYGPVTHPVRRTGQTQCSFQP